MPYEGGARDKPVSPACRAIHTRNALADKRRGEIFCRTAGDSLRPLGMGREHGRLDRVKNNWVAKVIDRALLVSGWFFISWYALQVLPVTQLVYHPDVVEIVGSEVRLARSFPGDAWGFQRPVMSYVETVRPISQFHNGGQSCTDKGGPFRYDRAESVGQWSIDWAADCLSDPSGYTWSADWFWHIGAMRVGPVNLTHRVLKTPCQFKVSSNGRIHGPDSPHWAQTSTDQCFQTRAEAEAAVE